MAFGSHFIIKVIISKWFYSNGGGGSPPQPYSHHHEEAIISDPESDTNFSAKTAIKKMILRFVD
jgi:hypothetical protein